MVSSEKEVVPKPIPMKNPKKQVALEVLPYLRVYKDGTLERIAGIGVISAGFDQETGVESKDIVIIPETGVFARIYRPKPKPQSDNHKLPVVVYFHGGAFCISSVADPVYHNSINTLVAAANVVLVSVNYRLVPEHPLPAAYDDCWAALKWIAGADEDWLSNVDFGKVFLAGDSCGANIGHHLAIRAGTCPTSIGLKFAGIIMINPYFWGEKPIGSEVTDPVRKAMVDCWWLYVCPSDKGVDDPLINPFVEGSPGLSGLACDRVIVTVSEKDILRDRGRLYYENLVKSSWPGKAEFLEVKDEDHVFHIFNPRCEKALKLMDDLASFINKD